MESINQLLKRRIIGPKDFNFPKIGEVVFFFFNLEHFYMFREYVQGGKVRTFGPSRRFRFEWKGEPAFALGGSIGAGLSVFIIENAIYRGAKKIIAFGTAGGISLQKEGIGSFVSPCQSIDHTGLSESYNLPKCNQMDDWPDVENFGSILSTNSIFSHTKEKIQNYRSRGIEFIDMESAALNSIIPALGARFLFLSVISDCIEADFTWTNGREEPRFLSGIERGIEALPEVLEKISGPTS